MNRAESQARVRAGDSHEESRYESRGQREEAEAITAAVTDDEHEVLQWLKRYW